jgi:predicted  nucleic acid-binding Zn-ribbon protein
MNDTDDSTRFTIRDEEAVPDSMYISDAENLRIEKLSTRVTLVAVLIPCLLVIVLVIAYLDIKNRVVNTQNSGSMGVQNLSKDLESRFSNLSLKQAKIEDQLANHAKALETANAAMQVNLKKATAALTQRIDGKLDQSALTSLSKKMESSIADLQKETAELSAAFSKFDEELAAQILVMAEGLKKDQGRLSEIEQTTQRLDSEKLSRESMNLALGLERLGLQEMVKDRIRDVEKKLAAMNTQITLLNQRLDALALKAGPAPTASAVPKPSGPAVQQAPAPAGSATIEEQTIN